MTDTSVLAPVIAEHIAAVNAFDTGRHRGHLRRRRTGQRRAPGVLGP